MRIWTTPEGVALACFLGFILYVIVAGLILRAWYCLRRRKEQ